MNEEIFFIQLRDCFTAGYTLPQFCIDNGIKKPLFVAADQRQLSFLWEVYVQFKYDKRLQAKFGFLGGKIDGFNFSLHSILDSVNFENLSDKSFTDYDKIIFITIQPLNVKIDNAIYLYDLLGYFIHRTYGEIPLLNFFTTSF